VTGASIEIMIIWINQFVGGFIHQPGISNMKTIDDFTITCSGIHAGIF
jgi:hypothetical protein